MINPYRNTRVGLPEKKTCCFHQQMRRSGSEGSHNEMDIPDRENSLAKVCSDHNDWLGCLERVEGIM